MPDPQNIPGAEPNPAPQHYQPFPAQTSRMYTHEEYQAMSTKQYLTGIAQVAAKLGVELDEEDTPRKQIQQIVEAVKANLTAAETAAKEKAEADAKTASLPLERQLAAIKAGVPADSVGRVIRYAAAAVDDKTDFDAALKAVMEDLKLAKPADGKGKSEDPKKNQSPRIVDTQSGEPGEVTKRWKQLSIKEQTEMYRKDKEAAIALAAADGVIL